MKNDDARKNDETRDQESISDAAKDRKVVQGSGGQADLPEKSADASPESKPTPGVILKRERETQSLSLEIVHEATKIPLDALRAIEEGYTIRMLSPFYYKGFVKMYADYLGIDASEVIEDYHSEKLPKHIERDADGFEPPQWIANLFTRKRKQQMVIVIGIILALLFSFKVAGSLFKKKPRPDVPKEVSKKGIERVEVKPIVEKPSAQVQPEALKIAVPKNVPKVEPKETPPAPAPVQQVVTAPPQVPSIVGKDIVLTVRAKQNSWLRVKVDGVTVFQSTLRLGAVETWTADDEIEISGKNVGQLDFELNGKTIGPLGRNDRNASKVVITKSGLSVRN